MGVYIKGMEMPKNCMLCPLCVEEADPANGEMCMVTGTLMPPCTRERLDNCPLAPVPPHGRLIDADELMHEFEKAQQTMAQHGREYSCSFMSSGQEISTEWYCVEDMLENAPTLLEAEEGE